MRMVTVILLGAAALAAFAEEPGQAQMDLANGWFSRGFYAEAAEEYRAYLEESPQGEHAQTALYYLGYSEHAAGNPEAAVAAFDKLLATGVDGAMRNRASLRKGECLVELKRFDEAAAVLKPLAGSGADTETRSGALYHLGKLHYARKDPAAARDAFVRLIQDFPDSPLAPFARYQLAYVFLALNETGKAAHEFAAVAVSDADPALRMESLYRAGEAFDQIGWYAEAAKAYEKLFHDFPGTEYAEKAGYGLGWAHYYAGDYGAAANAAALFAKTFPQSGRMDGVRYLAANCLYQQKQYDKAVTRYKALINDYPKSDLAGRARHKIAWALYLAGNNDEARQEVATFLKDYPNHALVPDAAFLLGMIEMARGNHEDAYEEFRLVAAKFPESKFAPEALYKSAECLDKLGRSGEAAEVFENFEKQFPGSDLAKEAILRAADARFLAGDFQDAIAGYKRVLEGSPAADLEEQTLYRLAAAHHNMEDYTASADAFKRLLDKYPATSHLAEAHLRIGDQQLREAKAPLKAIESYQAAYDAAPDGPFAGRALEGLALARYETKDYDGAAAMFLRVMTGHKDVRLNEDIYTWAGQRFFDEGKWEQASAAFRALLSAEERYPNQGRVRYKIAECSEKLGKTQEAIALYEEVVEKAPRATVAADAKYRMAKLHEGAGETERAFKLYEEAAEANTGDTAARARFRLGELYEAKEDYAAAARSYMHVAILFFHEELSPESLWRAGQCFERVQSPEQAKKAYAELVSDFPDTEQAKQAGERLTALG